MSAEDKTLDRTSALGIDTEPVNLDSSRAASGGVVDISRSTPSLVKPKARSVIGEKIFNMLRLSYKEYAKSSHPPMKWRSDLPTADEISLLCVEAIDVLRKESCLLRISPLPVYILGDIHGNFGDLYKFLDRTGLIHGGEFIPSKFLFLGDYIDRGNYDIECALFVLSLKVLYPDKVFLLRGNHEWKQNSDALGFISFSAHLKERFGLTDCMRLREKFFDVFQYLSLAAVVDDKVFCVHGGIPRVLRAKPDLDIINFYEKELQKPVEGEDIPFDPDFILYDSEWADPVNPKSKPAPGELPDGFCTSLRDFGQKIACTFTNEALEEFLEKYKFKMLVRAHECMEHGCSVQNSGTMITVFSSSAYRKGNSAGALLLYDHKVRILQMGAEPAACVPQKYNL